MRHVRRRWCAGLFIVGFACTVYAADVSFKNAIVPVFDHYCVACHLTGEEPGNLALNSSDAYANLVGRPSVESALERVKAGSPDDSYLVRKIEGTQTDMGGKGARMPLGIAALDAATIARIRAWIVAGAPNN